jgi:hypothetical protein
VIAKRLADAGFTELVSVVPPDGELSPSTRIAPAARGKAPARRNAAGQWYGYSFLKEDVPVAELIQTEANIGLRAAHFPGLDVDTDSKAFADAVVELALAELGDAPQRLSRAPRRMLVYRTLEPFNRVALVLKVKGKKHVVEFLGEGRQYLVGGQHPSGQQYRWLGAPLWDYEPDELPLITKDRAVLFLETLRAALQEKLPDADITLEGEGAVRTVPPPPQDTLEAPSIDALSELMSQLPNRDDDFPTRDDFLRVGFAVCAAGAPWPEEAYDAFAEWASRWPGGNDPNYVRRVWDSMKPPFRAGWGWLLDRSYEHDVDVPAQAQYEFEADENAEPTSDSLSNEGDKASYSLSNGNDHTLLRWSEWQQEEIAPAVWCVTDLIERGTRGFVFGPGGSGKSWFGYATALQMAHGDGTILSRTVTTPHAVYFCRAEGAPRDTHRCMRRVQNGGELPVNDHIVIDHAGYNLTKRKQADELIANVRRAQKQCEWGDLPLVLVFDPWSRLLGGASDSDREAKIALDGIDYVRKQLGDDVTVIIIHHVRKRQQGAGADKRPTMRGLSEYHDWCDFAIGFNKVEERHTAERKVVVVSEVWCEKQREMGFNEFAASLTITDETAVYEVVTQSELAETRAKARETKQAAQLAADVRRALQSLRAHVLEVMPARELRELMTGIANSRKDAVRDYLIREGQLEDAGRENRARMIRITERVTFDPEGETDGDTDG